MSAVFCKSCGKIMWNVPPQRKLCDRCRDLPPEEREKAKKARTPKPRSKPIKSLIRCVREADALGISYGEYVAKGYDRQVIDFGQETT